ncbi:hypothetical protein T439DRAFT_379687, partial [Meredithblackwellia eburnea MCA 4105]
MSRLGAIRASGSELLPKWIDGQLFSWLKAHLQTRVSNAIVFTWYYIVFGAIQVWDYYYEEIGIGTWTRDHPLLEFVTKREQCWDLLNPKNKPYSSELKEIWEEDQLKPLVEHELKRFKAISDICDFLFPGRRCVTNLLNILKWFRNRYGAKHNAIWVDARTAIMPAQLLMYALTETCSQVANDVLPALKEAAHQRRKPRTRTKASRGLRCENGKFVYECMDTRCESTNTFIENAKSSATVFLRDLKKEYFSTIAKTDFETEEAEAIEAKITELRLAIEELDKCKNFFEQ